MAVSEESFPCKKCHWKYTACDYSDNEGEGMDLREIAPKKPETGVCISFKDIDPAYPYQNEEAKKIVAELKNPGK